MKKLAILAAGAILLLGVLAVAAVLLVGDGGESPSTATPDRGATQPSGPVAPATTPVEGPSPASPGPGPRRVRLPAGRVKVQLSEPLAHCFRENPIHSVLPAVLTLELEAQASGGFAVLDSTVKSWGGATAGLVECARKTLRGQVVPGGAFPAGERAISDFELTVPPSLAPPPPPEPPPTTLPASRQPLPRRSGGSR